MPTRPAQVPLPSGSTAVAATLGVSVLVAAAGASAAGAAVSLSTGAGFSGSVPSVVGSSIHRTIVPSEYVCSALNTTCGTFGSGPSDTSNSWNWPGLMVASALAVQVIFVTASVIGVPCASIGWASFDLTAAMVQPATGLSDTEANGVSAGRLTSTLVVPAVSDSFGTRNVTLA
jgi:hypothetical protein